MRAPTTRQSEVGEIAEDWDLLKLREVTSEGTERNGALRLDRSAVLSVDNERGLTPSDRLLGEDFSRYKLVRRGQFAYNPMRLNVGSIGLYEQDPTALVSPDYIVFGCEAERLDPGFLDFFRRSDGWKRQIQMSGQGSIRIRYYYRHIAEFFVPLPALPEQRAVALVLRTVQRAKETAEAVVAAARQLKRSLLRHLFTYGPVSVEQAESVSVAETDYGIVPAAWSSSPLSTCAQVQTGVAKGRKLNGDEAVSLPYLRVANVQDGYLDLSEIKRIELRRSEIPRYSLQPGDVVLTEGGDFDKLGRGFIWKGEIPECVHQNHIFAVRPHRELLPDFFAYQTQSPYGKAYFLSVAHKTTNLACINTAKLKAFPVLLPPLSEQRAIVNALQAVDAKVKAEEEQASALDALFKTLLRDLMTGHVRVPEMECG